MELISENVIRCGSVQNAECFFFCSFFRKCLLSPGGDNRVFFLTELILVLGAVAWLCVEKDVIYAWD